ncbi:putative permease YjgP/YjgQ family protein [Escherichia coli P0305260.3]|uniref:LptF/LptG family permease n=1 Tax=Escherichia coli TaxID=562 RepID=UPI0002CB980B|nr:LptF/LptG family permease [Escherichia coli]ENG01233.1 putative permease YjgP/YjgQ family protein [Escherichia coli P0305260.3]
MNVFSRYLIRHLFLGFAAAAGLLLPLFTTFNLINELDDVSPGGYRWTQAVLVVLMTLPRTLVELSPFIALLGGIVGLGQLSKNSELTAIRSMGFSIFRIALVALVAGILWTVSLGAIDEGVASPLQQQALQIKSTATALGEDDDITGNMLWARRGNEFVTVKSLNEQGQPVGVEIFHYRDDLSLESYIYARSATIEDDKTWILHGVNHKKWLNGKETLETLDNLAWQSAFTSMDLEELSMPGNTFSVRQLNHYIHYLQETGQPSSEYRLALWEKLGQPSSEYRLALWEKLGQPILTLAMILLAVPFTFSAPRSPGMGSRLAVGVIVGLLTWISYQIMVNLGLLFALSAPVTALGLPIAFVLVALSLVYWYDRQH